MVNPLTRLKSTISTVTSTLQAVRELPGTLREVIEFARDNGAIAEEVEFWKSARDRWMDWACHVDGGQRTPGTDDSYDGDMDMMARIAAAIEENSRLRDALESMNRLYDERCNSHVVENKNMWEAAAKSAKEAVDLRVKLARYEAAETWLSKWRWNKETPCSFPPDTFVQYRECEHATPSSPNENHDNEPLKEMSHTCMVSELSDSDEWRPHVECLKFYEAFKDV